MDPRAGELWQAHLLQKQMWVINNQLKLSTLSKLNCLKINHKVLNHFVFPDVLWEFYRMWEEYQDSDMQRNCMEVAHCHVEVFSAGTGKD